MRLWQQAGAGRVACHVQLAVHHGVQHAQQEEGIGRQSQDRLGRVRHNLVHPHRSKAVRKRQQFKQAWYAASRTQFPGTRRCFDERDYARGAIKRICVENFMVRCLPLRRCVARCSAALGRAALSIILQLQAPARSNMRVVRHGSACAAQDNSATSACVAAVPQLC